ncbi:hypothetical protein TrST_g11707 [Triparma strigata]|uniref:Pyrroline-5-carboxylate reductase catalytic N-terminal domain-containing protein n=1 Tax=Triparma strigata TaxID=1606541 RepID=A0A9W7EE40_9STRA|nr:hypothetical protein TrST_g11707 [Triparma strigata]
MSRAFGVRAKEATWPLPTIAFLGGTGRMGVHLCAAWSSAGYSVTMCSRSKEKAQAIVDSLLSGKGYHEKASSGSVGEICVPPSPAVGWNLKAGTNTDAAEADMIVLGTRFDAAWPLLEAIAPKIRGQGKLILDITNPHLAWTMGGSSGKKGAALLPKDGPQSSIEVHKAKLDDPTARWAAAYKTVYWSLILPTGPKNPARPGVEVFGDEAALPAVCELVAMHGFQPVVRGGCDVAADFEGGTMSVSRFLGNMKREMFQGEKLSVGW